MFDWSEDVNYRGGVHTWRSILLFNDDRVLTRIVIKDFEYRYSEPPMKRARDDDFGSDNNPWKVHCMMDRDAIRKRDDINKSCKFYCHQVFVLDTPENRTTLKTLPGCKELAFCRMRKGNSDPDLMVIVIWNEPITHDECRVKLTLDSVPPRRVAPVFGNVSNIMFKKFTVNNVNGYETEGFRSWRLL